MVELGGKYELGERIGGGGMAEVFRGALRGAAGFSRPVAIKRMRRSLSSDPAFGKLFENEARLASLLMHPNIASVLDFDRGDDGRYFLVMELVPGVDLRELVGGGRVPVAVAVHIVVEILRGLDHAHELVIDGRAGGIIHRDISPHNVMLSWDGGVKVVDFGIAKAVAATAVSRSGALKGKVAYMSPEQAHGRELDRRSDLFSVGIVLHELLTGERLFVGDTEAEVLAQLLTRPIPRPGEIVSGVPADVEAVAMRLLEREVEPRYASARDAISALLDSSAASTRARLGLEEVLAARFGGKAPRAATGSDVVELGPRSRTLLGLGGDAAARLESSVDPVAQTLTSDAIPVPISGGDDGSEHAVLTSPERPLAREPRPALPRPTLTATSAGSLPIATPPPADATAAVAGPKRRRTGLWVGAALAVAMAVVAGSVVASSGGGDDDAAAARIDAGAADVADAAGANAIAAEAAAGGAGAGAASVEGAAGAMGDDAAGGKGTGPAGDAKIESENAAAGDSHADVVDEDEAADDAPAEADDAPRDRERGRARLEIKTTPSWGIIRVDGDRARENGVEYGQTPKQLELPAGRHTITVENPELGITASRRVHLDAGESETLVLELR